jgi:hypothetical protein
MASRWIVSVLLTALVLGGVFGCGGSESTHKNVRTLSSDRFPRGGGAPRPGPGPQP